MMKLYILPSGILELEAYMACSMSETFWCISISWDSISELSCSCCYLKHHNRLIEPSGTVNPAMNVVSKEFNLFDFILLEVCTAFTGARLICFILLSELKRLFMLSVVVCSYHAVEHCLPRRIC